MARRQPWPFAPFGSPSWLRPQGSDPALTCARELALSFRRGGTDRTDVLLAAVAQTREVADRLDWVLLSLVGEARGEGVSWEEIAAALGVSKQAAHKRYAPHLADAYARAGAGAEETAAG